MGISTILYIAGVVFLIFLLRRKQVGQNLEYDSYTDAENKWSIMTSFSEIKISNKYAGELRFGPAFIHIKTEPENVFAKEFYGDWFYRAENGVYLQKWNSNPIKSGVHTQANNDLIFYNPISNKKEIIKTGIKSFHWEIEKENNGLILISNDGKVKNRIQINNPSQ